MNESKKLLSFLVKDEFSLNESEIQNHAATVAQEQADENGWTSILVKLSGTPYILEDKFKCYPFDVFGNDGGNQSNGSSDSEDEFTHTSGGHGIAAQPSL